MAGKAVIGALAIGFAALLRGDVLVSNIGTNLATGSRSEYAPEEVRINDPRPCVAQSFGLPENQTSFWLTNVVIPVRHNGMGSVKAVLTLWSSMSSPGSSATPGLPMPQRPLFYLGSKNFGPEIFSGYQEFTPEQPVAIKAGEAYWVVLTYREESPGAFHWWSMDRHTNYSYKEEGPGALYWREHRNTSVDAYLPDNWIDSGIKTAAAIAIEGMPAPHLSVARRTDSLMEIQIRAFDGIKATVQFTETLHPAHWQLLKTAVLENGSATVIDQVQFGSSQRFYRVFQATENR